MESPGFRFVCVTGSEAADDSSVRRASTAANATIRANASSIAQTRTHRAAGGAPAGCAAGSPAAGAVAVLSPSADGGVADMGPPFRWPGGLPGAV
ncbi:hypothetical protein GCM10010400_21820 [Streptomyces aculeolatus]